MPAPTPWATRTAICWPPAANSSSTARSAWTNDTDGDGLTDGQEILTYGLNALKADSDGDGLSDYDELQLGANPWLMDTDLDWASDGYEVENNTDPTDPDDTPVLSMVVNEGGYYATSPDLALSFPGLVAEAVSVHEMAPGPEGTVVYTETVDYEDPQDGVLHTLSGAMPPPEEGLHAIRAVAVRGSETGPAFTERIVLDVTPPTLAVFSPVDDAITSDRWVRVSGLVSDEIGPVRVYVNGEWADGVREDGHFWYDRFPLAVGSNEITVAAEDLAGHHVEQVIVVNQVLSSDTNPPAFMLDYSPGTTYAGDVATMALHGSVSDESVSDRTGVASERSGDRGLVPQADRTGV